MKINKFLFLTPSVALATFIPLVSCGGTGWSIDDLEDALFAPHESSVVDPEGETFIQKLSSMNDLDKQKELVYGLFASKIYKASALYGLDDHIIYDLWKNGTIGVGANISKCSLKVEETQVYASFRGYINFVFVKKPDFATEYDVNDFIQITYLFDNLNVTPSGSYPWSLHIQMDVFERCLGIIQTSISSSLCYIRQTGTDSSSFIWAKNWHHWE